MCDFNVILFVYAYAVVQNQTAEIMEVNGQVNVIISGGEGIHKDVSLLLRIFLSC